MGGTWDGTERDCFPPDDGLALARPNGGDEVLIRTFQIAGGAVQRVSMQNKCSDNHGKVDVTVTELALKKTANAGESESAR